MSSLKFPHASFGETRSPAGGASLREIAAMALHSASDALARLAASLAPPPCATGACEPRLEFHCEAGAPEGALYLDGRLVAWVHGVKRL